MSNIIVHTETIDAVEKFAKKLAHEFHEYYVRFDVTRVSTKQTIQADDIARLTKTIYSPLNIKGDFPARSFDEVCNIVRDSLSWDFTGGDMDKSYNQKHIDQREKEFWTTITPYFSLPPDQCFEYIPTDDTTPTNEEPYFPRGTWWGFFIILCNDNQALLIEGEAYN